MSTKPRVDERKHFCKIAYNIELLIETRKQITKVDNHSETIDEIQDMNYIYVGL